MRRLGVVSARHQALYGALHRALYRCYLECYFKHCPCVVPFVFTASPASPLAPSLAPSRVTRLASSQQSRRTFECVVLS